MKVAAAFHRVAHPRSRSRWTAVLDGPTNVAVGVPHSVDHITATGRQPVYSFASRAVVDYVHHTNPQTND